MSVTPRPHAGGILLASVVFCVCAWFWVYWVPLQVGSRLPERLQMFLDEGSTPALLIQFVVLPCAIAALFVVAAVTSALLLRPFVARSEVRKFLEALPEGGYMGRAEALLLRIFKEERP
jgi:hypothetical protein